MRVAVFMAVVKKNWKYWIVLITLVMVSYANSLSATFVSDDISGILYNSHIGDLNSVFSSGLAFFRPLLYYILYYIGGTNATLFRLFNIVVHIGVVLLLYSLLVTIYKKKNLAFIIAAIFAVHPILVESVTWISGGSYALYSFFVLLSLLFYIKTESRWFYIFCYITSYVFALLSSEKAIVFLIILPVYEIVYGRIKKNWKKIVPLYLISFIWFIFFIPHIHRRLMALGLSSSPELFPNPPIELPAAVTYYIQLILWPHALSFYHSELFFSIADVVTRNILFFILLMLVIYFSRKNKHLFFWFFFFIISLLPTLTPYGVSWVVAERYVYLGTIGIIFSVVYIFSEIFRPQKVPIKFQILLVSAVVGALMLRTIVRNFDWLDEDHLWLATAKTSPHSAQNHNNLGDYYVRHGDLEKAIEEFNTAISLVPSYADPYHNLGNVYHTMKKDKEAKTAYLRALHYNPYLWQSYSQLGVISYMEKDYKKAIFYLTKATEINPNVPYLYSNLGAIYLVIGDKEKAQTQFLRAIHLDPQNAAAQKGLTEVLQ